MKGGWKEAASSSPCRDAVMLYAIYFVMPLSCVALFLARITRHAAARRKRGLLHKSGRRGEPLNK